MRHGIEAGGKAPHAGGDRAPAVATIVSGSLA